MYYTHSKLDRFLKAQKTSYNNALQEIKDGRKRSHWMWYILPQYKGLGLSETSQYYSINSLEEAKQFLNHPVLGMRLREISNELLKLQKTDAGAIFGSPDYLKLKSSMTLFAEVDGSGNKIFQKVLDKFYEGQKDIKTLALLKE